MLPALDPSTTLSASNPQDKSGNPAILKFGSGHSRKIRTILILLSDENLPDLTLKITNEKKKFFPKKSEIRARSARTEIFFAIFGAARTVG